MKRLATLFLGAAVVALGACGGGGTGAENNAAATDVVTLPEDEGEIGGDTLGNELGAPDAGNATDLNAVDANLAGDANLAADANASLNTQ